MYIYIYICIHIFGTANHSIVSPPRKFELKGYPNKLLLVDAVDATDISANFYRLLRFTTGGGTPPSFWVIFFSTHHQSSPLSQPSYGLCLNPWGLPSGHVRACGGRVDCVRRCRISCGGKWRSGTYGRWMVMVFPEILTTYIYI